MKQIIIIPILMILLLGIVSAEQCTPKHTFLGRLQDICAIPDNGVCEDAEYPINNEDCAITLEAFDCKGNRCIFREIWFAKVLLIVLFFMFVFYKDDYTVFIIVGLLLLASFNSVNSIDNVFGETKQFPVVDNEVIIPDQLMKENTLYYYGYKVMPSNPTMGMVIIFVAGALLIRYLIKRRRGY